MKRFVLSFLFVLGFMWAKCDTIYFDNNYNKVFEYALRDNKIVILDFYTVWCGGCRQYEKITFVDSTFKNYMLSNFYSAKVNAELVQNKKIAKKYSIFAYPTILITNPNGDEIDRIVGYEGDDIAKFISRIQNILDGKERLKYLDSLYSVHPDSLKLMRKIAIEKLYQKNDHKNLMKFSEIVLSKSTKIAVKNEARFFFALGAINNISGRNPQPIKNILDLKVFNDSLYIEECYSQLLNYYENIGLIDSVDYYYNVLIKFKNSGRHLGYVRYYARFLYENNRKIKVADNLAQEYSTAPGNDADHWTPFLLAHSAARHNNIVKGVAIFDSWLSKYSPMEKEDKSIWPYSFYIDYALFYKINLNKALEYAKLLESLYASKNNKKMVAKLLYLNGQKDSAISKLNEIIPLLDTQKEKDDIDDLIKTYNEK